MTAMISIPGLNGESFSAYAARPQGPVKGGILLIQEIFGINAVMRELAGGFAAEGYHVLAPDLFWRQEAGVDLSDQSEAEWAKAFALLQGFDQDLGLADLQASLTHLRVLGAGKVGAVGYCLGGRMAVLTALRTDVDAAVSYYGVNLGALSAEFGQIRIPLLLHIAEEDEYVPPAERAQVLAALAANPLAEAHVYEGRGHAFARPGGAHYHAEAAALANQRTRSFLEKTLTT